MPSKIEHSDWSALLEEYVDERGLVDYGSWEKSEADLRLLDDCQAQFAQETESTAVGTEEAAGLINAYRRWLSRPDLNSFEHSKGRMEISAIFDWYEEDFAEEAPIARKRTSHPGGDSVWIG